MKTKDGHYKFIIGKTSYHCALDITSAFIGGKWKAVVLWYLRNEKRRFSELKEIIPDITDKMLSTQLRALEKDELVKRTVFAQVPPKVEYQLTPAGKSLIPVLEAMAAWGRQKASKEGKMVRI